MEEFQVGIYREVQPFPIWDFNPWKCFHEFAGISKTWIIPLKGSLTPPGLGDLYTTIWWSCFRCYLLNGGSSKTGLRVSPIQTAGIHCYWTSRSPCTSPPPTVSWVLHWIEVCWGKQTQKRTERSLSYHKLPRFFGYQTCKCMVILEWFPFS